MLVLVDWTYKRPDREASVYRTMAEQHTMVQRVCQACARATQTLIAPRVDLQAQSLPVQVTVKEYRPQVKRELSSKGA
jgi:2-keto-3-deoxy-L-rhamnonate aldolase RhmA